MVSIGPLRKYVTGSIGFLTRHTKVTVVVYFSGHGADDYGWHYFISNEMAEIHESY